MGFALAGISFSIVKKEKRMIVFPLLSHALVLSLVALICWGLYARYGLHIFDKQTLGYLKHIPKSEIFVAQIVIFFTLIFVGTLIATTTSIGLVDYAIDRFQNKPTTVGRSLGKALSRFGTVALWSIISTAIGIILALIRENKKTQGIMRFILDDLLTMTWGIATFFAVPVIAQQNLGALASIKQSARLMKQTFGQTVGGQFGFGSIMLVSFFVISPLTGILLTLITNPMIGITAAILIFMFTAIMVNTATTVFKAAVYQFANNQSTGAFGSDVIKASFK